MKKKFNIEIKYNITHIFTDVKQEKFENGKFAYILP